MKQAGRYPEAEGTVSPTSLERSGLSFGGRHVMFRFPGSGSSSGDSPSV